MQLINVMAASIDGRIGLHDCESDLERQQLGLSGAADQLFLRQQIQSCDGIIVGASSIRANGECLAYPGRTGQAPVWYIFAQNPLPFHFKFWQQTHIPRRIISEKPMPLPVGSDVINIVYGNRDPALFLYEQILKDSIQHCLLFGGGLINSWFYQKNLVDELRLTLAPLILGQASTPFLVAPNLSNPVKFFLLASHSEESFVFLRYKVLKT